MLCTGNIEVKSFLGLEKQVKENDKANDVSLFGGIMEITPFTYQTRKDIS